MLGFLALAVALAAGLAAWAALEFTRELGEQRTRIGRGSRLVETRCGVVEVGEADRTGHAGQASQAERAGQADRAGQAGQAGQSGEAIRMAAAAAGASTPGGPGAAISTLPLLVVHGSGGGFDQGLALGADYAARGWRVIAPSRFGYLRTPWPADGGAVTGERQADQLACLLDALGVEAVAVLGVSAGAIAATEFAVRHPQRTKALILMVPAGYKPEETPPMPGWAQTLLETVISADLPFWLVSRLAPDVVRRFVLATPPAEYAAAPAAEQQRVDRTMREILPISARHRGLLHDTLATQRVPRPRFEAIRAPTLAVSARDDGFGTLASASYAAQAVPRARLLVFERGGHLLLNHQAEVVAAVEALLREAEADDAVAQLSPGVPAPASPSKATGR